MKEKNTLGVGPIEEETLDFFMKVKKMNFEKAKILKHISDTT